MRVLEKVGAIAQHPRTMPEEFTHDVFLSQSFRDETVVRAFAEQLRAGGLAVWFDEWEIKPST